ncbi:MAG: L,D-transpeptidase family protein [Ferruginibacter sp.]|nr:L,D-transpeptidase family protein [Ferruginibacter sp.]
MFFFTAIVFFFATFLISCNSKNKTEQGYVIVKPTMEDEKIQEEITSIFESVSDNKLTLQNTPINYVAVVKNYYQQTEYVPIWSKENKLSGAALNLVNYLQNAALQGLYNADYNFEKIKKLKNELLNDTLKTIGNRTWANADILFTDAFVGLLKDLKQGRLHADSLSWKFDTSKHNKYFGANIEKIKYTNNIDSLLESVQPKHEDYINLKKGIKRFVDSMDNHTYTYVNYPYKDTLAFNKILRKRLTEAGIKFDAADDSLAMSNAIKTYQHKIGLTADGKIGATLVKRLNINDKQRFNIIAITLDKYKLLPDKMPPKYIWVNLPTYQLKVFENDTIVLESKIICGKAATPTPLLTSAITDIVLYPTWTVPNSIITKDMLPGLKRNTNYLARRGLYLLNGKGQKINASSINWNKYTKGIPYRIQQGSGNSNALGIIKFNFDNEYSVYLHDTNQRYLFKNSVRCLSHGCVRVQEWQKLADYIIRNDSVNLKKGDSLKVNTDSIKNWMLTKINRKVNVNNKIPLYIRYFACELVNDKIKFFDDIYEEDKNLKQKYFANK